MTTNDDSTSVGKKAVQLLVENGYGPKEEFRGCTDDEIQDIENECNVELPEAYISCMKKIGKYAGGFQRGTEFFYPSVKSQKRYAKNRVSEWNVDFEFESDDFVFCGLQGYSFWFFNTRLSEDPPVFHYMEGDEEATKVADSFSEWLFDEIRQ